jgi:hypothetical protein
MKYRKPIIIWSGILLLLGVLWMLMDEFDFLELLLVIVPLALVWLTYRFIKFGNRRRWRFSLMEMLTAMTVFAVVLGLIVYVVRD